MIRNYKYKSLASMTTWYLAGSILTTEVDVFIIRRSTVRHCKFRPIRAELAAREAAFVADVSTVMAPSLQPVLYA